MIVPSIDPIKYLVYRKFPDALKLARQTNNPNGHNPNMMWPAHDPIFDVHKWPVLSLEAEQYRKELEALSKQDVQDLFAQETKRQHEKDDEDRFFNQPDAVADFDFWSKAAHWTLNEAIALTFGKDPRVVTWARLEKISSFTSPFVQKFIELRDLTTRAKAWKKLFDPVLPSIYIAWARQNDIPFPQELADKIIARGDHILDWKKAYEDLLTQKNEYYEQVKSILEKRDALEQLLRKENEQLKLQVIEISGQKQDKSPVEKPLTTRERETVLKLIIGMAIKGYSYDPKASKNPTAKEISDDLDMLGLSVSDDTIRKWLKEAIELLPPDTK